MKFQTVSLVSAIMILVFNFSSAFAATEPKIVLLNKQEADRVCKHFNWFVWWSCRDEIENFTIQQDILNLIIKLRDTTELDAEVLKNSFREANGSTYDSTALDFLTQHGLVRVGFIPQLLNVMKNSRFEIELLGMCNSRNSVMSITSPILSARSLNQPAILNCINIVKDVRLTLKNKSKVLSCRLQPEIVSRNTCLAENLQRTK